MIQALFAAIDRKDADAFSAFLTDDCVFRFGNQPAVSGRADVQAYVTGFFSSVQALSHRIDQRWHTGDAVICHGAVTYTRHDGSLLTVPFCNVLNLAGDLVREYLIFADTSALYAG
ncbi:nuclear transport factor 2 family protein [Thalassolituus sp. LLYu03]|uniref:nuclear transport factor 2 family protein n=1 Tax=Thalassolituus sp. LLYu03 TaxID=3421656 RepID=UPI003D2946CC